MGWRLDIMLYLIFNLDYKKFELQPNQYKTNTSNFKYISGFTCTAINSSHFQVRVSGWVWSSFFSPSASALANNNHKHFPQTQLLHKKITLLHCKWWIWKITGSGRMYKTFQHIHIFSPYLLIKVTEILMMCLLRASWELSDTTGVRWPVQFCHFQPVCEVHHATTFKLQRKD